MVHHVLAICQAVDAGHGGDGLVAVVLLVHEDWEDEVSGGEPVLTDARPEGLAAPVPAGPGRQVLQGRSARMHNLIEARSYATIGAGYEALLA